MAIFNPTFDLCPAPTTPWEASGWVYAASAACRVAGFGTYEDPWELFLWSEFSLDTSSWAPALFSRWTNLYEDFDFGGLIDEWSPSWLVSASDDFGWGVWDPVFRPGLVSGYDGFTWSVFSDVFVPGSVCLFDAGSRAWEEFETW